MRGSALHIDRSSGSALTWLEYASTIGYILEPVNTQCSYAFLLRTFCTPVHVSEKIKSAHVTHFSTSDWLHPWTRFIISTMRWLRNIHSVPICLDYRMENNMKLSTFFRHVRNRPTTFGSHIVANSFPEFALVFSGVLLFCSSSNSN